MLVLTNILAYLFIIAAVAFFAALAGMAAAGLRFYGNYKRVKAMAERPKNAAVAIFKTGKGAAMRDSAHIRAIAASAKQAAARVNSVRNDITEAARTIHVEDTREAAESAKDTVASALSNVTLGLQVARQLLGVISQAQRTNGNHHRN
jgi:hypothetical protein